VRFTPLISSRRFWAATPAVLEDGGGDMSVHSPHRGRVNRLGGVERNAEGHGCVEALEEVHVYVTATRRCASRGMR